ncbi:MAG: glycoside hydrolase family 3 N-terminal domain-containing protein [Planctomycetota bacterium]
MRRVLPLVLATAAASVPAQDAAAVLARLSLAEKAGQVLMVWSLSRAEGQASARARILRQVEELGLGGVVLSLGPTEDAVAWAGELQAASTLPLLLAGDFESGCGFRLSGAADLGKAMLLGAAGDERLTHAAAEATAQEARAMGFHWNFAPVLDVNVNPANPIINVRSFGEDPQLVARLGAAYVRGLRAGGVLSTAKHFPGHGDVATDSHLAMPTVSGDRARLDAVELLPFRAAVAAGVDAVMTGHLAVPALGETVGVPATLSPKISTDVLRGELGFRGIVVTDALDMGGVKGEHEGGEVAVRALLAGADVLLMPPDPARARAALVEAVEAGRVPRARLDEAVGRVLRAKEAAGLLRGAGRPSPDWRAVVGPAHAALAQEIARRGLTLVRDRDGLVPLAATDRAAAIVVEVFDNADAIATPGGGLAGLLEIADGVALHPKSPAADIAAAAERVRASSRPIVAWHVRVRAYSGRIGIAEAFSPLVAALRQHEGAIAVSFGNPYLLREFASVSTYLCAYETTAWTEQAVADALRGRTAVTGRLPITIPDLATRGCGASRWPLPTVSLPHGEPEALGFAPELVEHVRTCLEGAVADHAFPGAVCAVARRGTVVATVAVGRETYAADAPAVRADSKFDLASLTKVCATLPATLRLCAAGKLSLDTRVAELLPDFVGPGKDRVTVRHLLTHSAGLVSWLPLFRTCEGKEAVVRAAIDEGLRTEPGTDTVYSDLGLILLMACLERASGRDFGALVRDEVFAPLGMAHAGFGVAGTEIAGAVPTEACKWRSRVLRGEVHDENAFAMGGTSGHAGLFATADDVLRVGCVFLAGGCGYLPPALAQVAIQRAELPPGSSRALGWDTFVAGGSGGSKLGANAFGHTGFTGTSIWCDPATDLCVVLLSNRVHPTRVNAKIKEVRRRLHDLVVGDLR